jgi:8-oxo-dGTP diphosphatase
VQDATLCFPVDGPRVLLIHKKRGVGAGLYNGPGGKVEADETPRECAVRETEEEVGVGVRDPEKLAELEFVFGDEPFMYVHAYRATEFDGVPRESPEADPEWFHREAIPYDEMWPDDRHWLPHLLDGDAVAGTFRFDADGDELLEHELETSVEFDE